MPSVGPHPSPAWAHLVPSGAKPCGRSSGHFNGVTAGALKNFEFDFWNSLICVICSDYFHSHVKIILRSLKLILCIFYFAKHMTNFSQQKIKIIKKGSHKKSLNGFGGTFCAELLLGLLCKQK